MRKILIAEDNVEISDMMKSYLVKAGYEVCQAFDGFEALAMAKEIKPDLALLDIMMPKIDGFEVCQTLRKTMTMPIIVVSAKVAEEDKVRMFDLGADDYITKPFNILELKARIRALLRRANAAPQQKQPETLLLTAGGITLDPEQRVAVKNGEIVELTAKEYDLIELLVKNPRRVYSRENLMDLVWGYTYAGDYRTVDVHIRRLREKLEHDPAEPEHIMTKWGVGYYLKD